MKQVQVGQPAKATIQGFDQNGNAIALDSTYKVVYSASDPENVTFGAQGVDGSVDITALAPDANEQIGAVITLPDGTTVVTASADQLVITAPPAPVLTSAKVVLA